MRRIELENITIKGFKSIQSLENFQPKPINVFIGQNGAGKSNFISFFKFLANMLGGTGNLQEYTGLLGGASKILFDGAEVTTQFFASLTIITSSGKNEYKFRLSHASPDTFIFTDEQFRFAARDRGDQPNWYTLGAGQREPALINSVPIGPTQGRILQLLRKLVVYQFHNTTSNSPIRSHKAAVENGFFLEEDGRNLAAVLFELQENRTAIYQKIIGLLQQIFPFFDAFNLYNEYGQVFLRWKEKGSNITFVANQASDGMLRAMALVTLLCLPQGRLPEVIFIDEPELGLHPSAISTICSLLKAASLHCQVFIATQNADMLNEFNVEDVVVVSRNGRSSEFKRLNEEELSDWIQDYSLADLWNRNILGGRP